MSRVLVGCAEVSGDLLAAEVLSRVSPGPQIDGILGPRLQKLPDTTPIAGIEQLRVMGIGEVLPALPRILQLRRRLESRLSAADLFLSVDAPDFNLPVARKARAMGKPAVLLGSPQVWAWRRRRAARISATASEVLCLLPFEPGIYRALGGRARFVGSPVAERAELLPAPTGGGLALLPGSRPSEVRRLWPTLVQVARRMGGPIHVARAPGIPEEALSGLDCQLHDSVAEALAPSRVALVASGTATLEVACMERPQVVVYAVAPSTYVIGRALVRGVDHLALPNLVLGRRAIPEHLQHLDPDAIARDLEAALVQAPLHQEIRALLRPEGARARLAQALQEHL